MLERPIDTHQKALALNLDPKIYGTIAEIGAGQEVARWFFRVGGAAGTIAKTISAYDMEVSDGLYGKASRYVSRDRVRAMLSSEFSSLAERLGQTRGVDTRFFAFSDSVAARNYAGTNECHGWLGARYQTQPGADPEEIVLHVNMRDNTNQLQQEALGVLGVNLLYGLYFRRGSAADLLVSLRDNLAPQRLEIDAIYCTDTAFNGSSAFDLGIQLIGNSLGEAVLFDSEKQLLPPTEVFHNEPLVLLRARLSRPPVAFHGELLVEGAARFKQEIPKGDREPLTFVELTIDSSSTGDTDIAGLSATITGALEHADRLLVTRYRENYLLARYLRRFSPQQPIRVVLGSSSLVLLFQDQFYTSVPGRLLEGLGRFFSENVKVYIKSTPRHDFEAHLRAVGGELPGFRTPDVETIGLEHLTFDPPYCHLFEYLRFIRGPHSDVALGRGAHRREYPVFP